jgi:polysaccharide export outer membrane protein
MRVTRILVPVLVALAAAGCLRHDSPYYGAGTGRGLAISQASDPGTYQSAPTSQSDAQANARALYGSPQAAQQEYSQPMQPAYTQPQQEASGGRGLFNSHHRSAQAQYAQPAPQDSYVVQYQAPALEAQQQSYAAQVQSPQYHTPQPAGGPYVAAQDAYAAATYNTPQAYTLDSGDKLRIVVFGQEGISGTYLVDAGGNITLPLAGTVHARGVTTQHLAHTIVARLKRGYIREPHVTVSIDTYRPFFILGEVTTPGQYAYVPNMTVENAVAVAGGFTPRAAKRTVELSRNADGQQYKVSVPLNYQMRPGDTVVVQERWF